MGHTVTTVLGQYINESETYKAKDNYCAVVDSGKRISKTLNCIKFNCVLRVQLQVHEPTIDMPILHQLTKRIYMQSYHGRFLIMIFRFKVSE